jgi:hypothetical protein
MINGENPRQLSIEEFKLPFGNKLEKRNRWVQLADEMPWEELTKIYNEALSTSKGRPAIRARVVVGALIIKHMQKLSDEETIEQIRENPYLQYFLGYSCYSYDNKFEPSLFTTIRERLGDASIEKINDKFINRTKKIDTDSKRRSENVHKEDGGENCGMILVDATVAPSDIKYPTDIGLLNEVREESERLIDALYEPQAGKVKPRTYRMKAHKAYLLLAKKRHYTIKEIRKGLKGQLGYIKRNFQTIDSLLDEKGSLFSLSCKDQERLWVIREVYRQQEIMYRTKTHSIESRIVSISQPYVRPIVRGKAGAQVEFGPKISVSVVDGNAYLDNIGWEAFNESGDLPMQVENYFKRFGYYPEVVVADKIYGTRANRTYLREKGIRYSGVPLGRQIIENKKDKKRRQKEAGIRNRIEGAFGVGKRKFGLGLVMTKLRKTSENWIAMVIFVMNISRWLRDIFVSVSKTFINGLFALIVYCLFTPFCRLRLFIPPLWLSF